MERMKNIKKIFDDITVNSEGQWSQICESCRDKHNLTDSDNYSIDYNSGHGICGVEGCENESDHYIAFNQ